MVNLKFAFLINITICLLFSSPVTAYSGHRITCDRTYYKLGCYRDRRWARAMSELLINDRSRRAVDWETWNHYIQGLACRCAFAASSLGYKMFGLQNYGECWSGPDVCSQYSRHGDSYQCIGQNYTTCDINDHNECVGKGNANFVYLILTD